jgi:glucose-6-phosphate-specific signal transduction histidine kinase
MPVEHNKEWVASIISGLLGAVVMHAKDTCIRLTARKYGHVVVLEIRESGCISTYAMACNLQDVQTLAEKIGGCLTISINKEKTTTIAFSFPNLPVAA